jgi:hypothetical protein
MMHRMPITSMAISRCPTLALIRGEREWQQDQRHATSNQEQTDDCTLLAVHLEA